MDSEQTQGIALRDSRETSSAQSPNRLGRVMKGAWRRLGPSKGDKNPIAGDNEATKHEDIKGQLGLNLLHSPPSPQIDFIFVHGLGGGSRKTWSCSPDPKHFWPKTWLPEDQDFASVRIHSFGYSSTWDNLKKSNMSILDFARALIGDISCHPLLRKSNTKIVLIGHSMGGIVIKKAFMLAQEDQELKFLVDRIHTLCFLATPHSGSDMANMLTNIVKVCCGPKPFVGELRPNSESIASINDSFRHLAASLKLLSFYESNPQILQRIIIVDKNSAILGLPHEKCYPLDADHRGVCKFESQRDPNYQKLRNVLSTTVDQILSNNSQSSQQVSKVEHEQLVRITDVSEVPDQDLFMLEGMRITGTCEWLINKDVYEAWQAGDPLGHHLFWLSGNAGSGKSILSSKVVNELQDMRLRCSYFFFKRGNTQKSTVSGCLRALAFQMAMADASILRKLLHCHHGFQTWKEWDENTLWRKVFLGCIFLNTVITVHYWVIDAVDECQKNDSLLKFLANAPPNLRIFITSRPTAAIDNSMRNTENTVSRYQMQEEDTNGDFSKFIDSSMDRVPVSYGSSRESLKQEILQKASGSFLWVSLVIKRLEEAYSEEEAKLTLSEVPAGMNELYATMLESVVQSHRTTLTKSIYMWALLSFRPLKIAGLQLALKLDNQTVPNLGNVIPAISGQLLRVNRRREAELVHQTARTYLLQQDTFPGLEIHKKDCHTHVAKLCLTVLAGSFTKGWQPLDRKSVYSSQEPGSISDFADYASEYFSDHLQRSSSEDDINWELLRKFLDGNLLIWIEHLAKKRHISSVTRTARNLRAYFNRRVKYLSPISPQKAILETWIYDLFRLGAKFGNSLVTSPSSIYTLIPAICPSESVFSRYRLSRLQQKCLTIHGLEQNTWDDCVARMDYPARKTSAVSCGNQYFAIALSDGTIYIYFLDTTQIKFTLSHGAKANVLAFSSDDKFFASSGQRKIKVWDPHDGIQLWAFDTSHQVLALIFVHDDDDLAAITQGNYTISWDLAHGQENGRWQWTESIGKTGIGKVSWPQPHKAVFSPSCNRFAVSYRGHPLYVFDFIALRFLGSFARESHTSSHYPVDAMAFNPSLEINVLVVSYGDGELTIYDIETTQLRFRKVDVFAHSLKCSPNGRTLITGSARGTLQIFEFAGARGDCVLPLYFIDTLDEGIKDIAFSSNSLRFADIRGTQSRIWEPAILDCQGGDEGSFQSDLSQAVSIQSKSVGMLDVSSDPEITALCSTVAGNYVFCGKTDGSVVYFETGTAIQRSLLYKHSRGASITSVLFVEQSSLLVSADTFGCVLISSVQVSRTGCELLKQVAEIRSEKRVFDLIQDEANSRLLLKGREVAEVWTMEGLFVNATIAIDVEDGGTDIAFANHPSSSAHFIAITPKNIRIFCWANAQEVESSLVSKSDRALQLTPSSPMPNEASHLELPSSNCLEEWEPPLIPYLFKRMPSIQSRKKDTVLRIYAAASIVGSCSPALHIPLPKFCNYFDLIRQIIGVDGHTVFFLDMELWVCSIDVTSPLSIASGARRHFFLLSEWQDPYGKFLVHFVPTTREFLVISKHQLLVMAHGLDFEEPWVDAS
ncbi:hypothetical protein VTL71DRAFT_13583 [Oculimacula yallundae]|uniref:GPI inositol-deacylase n=1 Tax=Oculimacula yallundae TaxID=86028 RepID=A0ABR4CLE0_9HELO